jgi:hypothetical protein
VGISKTDISGFSNGEFSAENTVGDFSSETKKKLAPIVVTGAAVFFGGFVLAAVTAA